MRNLVLQNGKIVSIFIMATAFFMLPRTSIANDLKTCMTEMLYQVSDSLTIAELRLECEKQIHEGTYPEKSEQPSALSKRLGQDTDNVLKPFTLMAHKPNYLLIAAHNTYGYNAEPYQEQYDNPSLELKDTEAQFQLSIKFPLAVNLFDTVDIYGAYTNRSSGKYIVAIYPLHSEKPTTSQRDGCNSILNGNFSGSQILPTCLVLSISQMAKAAFYPEAGIEFMLILS